MKPEIVYPVDNNRYVYAICRCPLDTRYGLKMKRKSGVSEYLFHCDICNSNITVSAQVNPIRQESGSDFY